MLSLCALGCFSSCEGTDKLGTGGSGEKTDPDPRPTLIPDEHNAKIAIKDFFSESRFSSCIGAVEDLVNEFTKMLDLEPVEL